MAHKLTIQISNKIATCLTEKPLVCGNSDYIAEFLFDEEWSAHTVKTARFRVNGEYIDVVFEGNTCEVPIISKAKLIWVGVFAGDLSTSTPAIVTCVPSILDNEDIPAPPREDVYSQIMEKCNEAVELVKDLEERAESGEFATGEIDYSKVNEYVDKVCEGKEDKTNKVYSISTVEEITDEKAYPSAKAVQEYGAALANDLISMLPRKLSDLTDDSNVDSPLNYARYAESSHSAIHADRATHDEQGFEFPEYYASKREVAEVYAKKLDREWKLLGWEEVTQADTGVTTLAVPCGDMSNYVELMCRIEIPQNTLNDKNYHFRVGLSAGGEILPHSGNGWLMTGQGYTDFMMDKSLLVRLAIKSTFINGRHAYNEIVKDYYGAYKSPMGGNIATMFGDSYYHAVEIAGKNTYWFRGNTEDDTSSYILPAGTRIEIYGR